MTQSLRAKAIGLLARREHCRRELERKLRHDGPREDVDRLLDELQRSGYLSDARFAEAFVAGRSAGRGTMALRNELRQRGVSDTIAEQAMAELATSEADRALAVLRRKYAGPPADDRDRARRARFLQGRGFAPDTVRWAVKRASE